MKNMELENQALLTYRQVLVPTLQKTNEEAPVTYLRLLWKSPFASIQTCVCIVSCNPQMRLKGQELQSAEYMRLGGLNKWWSLSYTLYLRFLEIGSSSLGPSILIPAAAQGIVPKSVQLQL